MKRAWLALALLSASWLMGLNYYQEPNSLAWLAAVAAAVLLLGGISPSRLPSRAEAAVAMLLVAPALWVAPGVYRAIPVLIFAGLLLCVLPLPLAALRRLGLGSLFTGIILLVQAVVMYAYEALTARSHELPPPLASLLAALARLLGIDAAANGNNVELFTMRRIHPIGATWELLLDPVTLCFLAGGLVLLALCRPRIRLMLGLLGIVLAWLPLRVALLLGLYLHRALLTDYDAPLDLMNQFFSPWTHLLLTGGPVLLAWGLLSPRQTAPDVEPEQVDEPRASAGWRRAIPPAAVAALAGTALLVFGLFWCPSGVRKGGRVVVDEFHSTWEPTNRPYDTEWYGHESGYNYSCIYDYCSRYYDTSRLTAPITAGTLNACDVLVVKVPTAAYEPAEVDAIVRFVRGGGGLLLIGEHTDVFGTGTHLNAVSRPFGFTYRFDCVFGIRSVFEQLYEQPLLAHPVVQRMPPLDFEISCSIAPGLSPGRAAIRGTGLKNAFADYHASNFYPQVDDFPDSRYGSFVQLWTSEQGDGRVAAFSDSTQFSNFSTFEAGKPEMMLGMVEWLNRRNAAAPVAWMAIGGAVLLLSGFVMALRRGRWLLPLCAALLGWAFAVPAVRAANRAALPPPPAVRPMTRVAIDRTVCDCVLSKGGFIGGRPDAFGIFDRWILRLGWFTSRRAGYGVFDSDLIVFFQPDKDVDRAFRDKLTAYVESGGHVLVLDSPENEHSTANSLLFPFKLALKRPMSPLAGIVTTPGLPMLDAPSSLEVEGGETLAQLTPAPPAAVAVVAARAKFGKGSVTVVGFASRFNDSNMGVTGDLEPDATLRSIYDYEFGLLRGALGVSPPPPPPPPPTTAPATTQP